jgi:hypothetical protein
MKKLVVYVAGPYTSSPCHGTRSAIDAWKVLVDNGYLPLVPHTDLIIDIVYPMDEDFWYGYTLNLLEATADILLRLPGKSTGADREWERAGELGLPRFRGSAEEFVVMFGSDFEVKRIERRRNVD